MLLKSPGQKEIADLFTAFIGAVYGFGMCLFPAMVESICRNIDFSYSMLLISGTMQAGFLVSSALAGFLTLRFGVIGLILFSIVLRLGPGSPAEAAETGKRVVMGGWKHLLPHGRRKLGRLRLRRPSCNPETTCGDT